MLKIQTHLQLAALTLAFAADVYAAPLEIDVNNVKPARGGINISLFATPASWDTTVPTSQEKIFPLTAGTSRIVIDVPPGEYAFVLYNDLNNNNDLDKSFVGFPAEPYAFSNNVHISFSKPSYNSMKFRVPPEGVVQTVTLIEP